MKNVNNGHRQRMRERFVSEGIHNFAEHEVLEMMLYMCIPYKDTNKIAHQLISRLGSLSAVMDAPTEVLEHIAGISTTSAINIHIMREVWERYKISRANNQAVSSLSDIVDNAKAILDSCNYESMIVYYLDGNSIVLGHELFAGDNHGSIYVNNKDIVTSALAYNALGVVLVHNHPRGICKPSISDIKYTEGLYFTLKGIDVTLLDHTVLGTDGTHSMAVSGMLRQVREKYN